VAKGGVERTLGSGGVIRRWRQMSM
jgi:hypothetical protein